MNLSVPELKLPVIVFLLFFFLAVPALSARGNAESSEQPEQPPPASGSEVPPDTETPPEAGNPPDEPGGWDSLPGAPPPEGVLSPEDAVPAADSPADGLPAAEESSPPEIDEDSISVILDSGGFLRLITAGKREDTSISRAGNTIRSTVNSGEKNAVERRYDSRFRTVREILWKREPDDAGSSGDAGPGGDDPVAVTFYDYEGDSFSPVRTRRETAAGTTVTVFNSLGLVERIEEYALEEEFLFSEAYEYDREKRVVMYLKTLPGNITEKTEYFFGDEEQPPDTKQWINDILVQETVYTSHDEWRVTAWFEDDFTVHVYFRDGLRYKEEYMRNGIVLRTRQF